ncbi:MAG TPA: DUF1801 domain-containing protein [Rhizomicrobium sp.]|nr:DUF1801 domain-containing protein [Rhizomicrobium sp.]
MPAAATVDTYIKAAPQAARPMLKELRALVKQAAPKAEEYISYGMPYYRHHGALLGFAAFKQHIGFFPGAIVADFAEALKGYKTSRGTVQLPYGQKIPVSLIGRIVKAGVKRNEDVARAKKKAAKKNVRKS